MKLHKNDPEKFSCPLCDTSFLMKSGLKTHLRRHMGDRRYPCNICYKSFFTANERKKHVMIHTGTRLIFYDFYVEIIICSIGERPYECKYCDRKFATTFNQKVHLMTHSGPYLCEICLKGLADKDILQWHMKYKHCTENTDGNIKHFSELLFYSL